MTRAEAVMEKLAVSSAYILPRFEQRLHNISTHMHQMAGAQGVDVVADALKVHNWASDTEVGSKYVDTVFKDLEDFGKNLGSAKMQEVEALMLPKMDALESRVRQGIVANEKPQLPRRYLSLAPEGSAIEYKRPVTAVSVSDAGSAPVAAVAAPPTSANKPFPAVAAGIAGALGVGAGGAYYLNKKKN